MIDLWTRGSLVRSVPLLSCCSALLLAACATSRAPSPKAPGPQPASQPAPSPNIDPWSGASDLITAPPLKPTGALRLPPRSLFELPNGLTVLALPDATLPLVDVGLYVRVGSIDDPAYKVGLADFTAAMLRQGIRGMTADAISRRVDAEGASLEASSGYDLSQISCSARAKTLDLCVELVSRLASQPTLPAREMKQIRQRLLAQVRSVRDHPHALAAEHFHNMLYGDDHPAGRPLTARSVGAIERGDLVRFHRQFYLPGAAVLVVSGDFELGQLHEKLSKTFGRWRRRKARSRWVSAVKQPSEGFRLLLVDKPDLSQSFFSLGHAGIGLTHPDRDALRLVNYVLGGGGFSSRLMQTVRSRGGKTYGISSVFSANEDDGHFVVSSFTRNDQIVATLELVREQLSQIRTRPPTADELGAAKGKIAGGFALAFPTASALAGALGRAHLRGLPETYVSELPLRVERQDTQSTTKAAREHVRPDRIIGAVVGKAEVVAPLLKAAGISFEVVSYRDPISAAERAQPKPQSPPAAKSNE